MEVVRINDASALTGRLSAYEAWTGPRAGDIPGRSNGDGRETWHWRRAKQVPVKLSILPDKRKADGRLRLSLPSEAVRAAGMYWTATVYVGYVPSERYLVLREATQQKTPYHGRLHVTLSKRAAEIAAKSSDEAQWFAWRGQLIIMLQP